MMSIDTKKSNQRSNDYKLIAKEKCLKGKSIAGLNFSQFNWFRNLSSFYLVELCCHVKAALRIMRMQCFKCFICCNMQDFSYRGILILFAFTQFKAMLKAILVLSGFIGTGFGIVIQVKKLQG